MEYNFLIQCIIIEIYSIFRLSFLTLKIYISRLLTLVNIIISLAAFSCSWFYMSMSHLHTPILGFYTLAQ
ncbi:uncharacterized protein BDZ83DRAFT_644274 [Colletotrichum acutatum]|uniref:Uncharacterized protein n=1 Tax=Glomerella acutata TaxID=27357 RepID=A0AAD8U9Q4_GLOAC|nr:uncharacterized protein BDZ83DRAFT_644274 [Colletotrichum acutatum]KAK1705174.1 hypothetical protein BDZ83DRAFT_644274 [Colletotrichum acutatum]